MRNIIFRFTIAMLSFGLGVMTVILATPLRLRNQGDAPSPQAITLRQKRFKFVVGEIHRAEAVAQTVRSMREIKTDSMDTNVPPAAKPLLAQLKRQLLDLIIATINAHDNRRETPRLLSAMIRAQLEAAGVTVKEPPDEISAEEYFSTPYVYGDIHSIEIEQPAGHPNLLAATTKLGVCCGTDSSLYLFERSGSQWQLVLAQEAGDYEEVSGAQGRFSYAVSPPDGQSGFFVVTANVNPWCTSNWQSIRYKALRPGADPYQPRAILNETDTIYLGDYSPYQLRVKHDGFTLNFAGDGDPEEVTSRHFLIYTINGDHATQVLRYLTH